MYRARKAREPMKARKPQEVHFTAGPPQTRPTASPVQPKRPARWTTCYRTRLRPTRPRAGPRTRSPNRTRAISSAHLSAAIIDRVRKGSKPTCYNLRQLFLERRMPCLSLTSRLSKRPFLSIKQPKRLASRSTRKVLNSGPRAQPANPAATARSC